MCLFWFVLWDLVVTPASSDLDVPKGALTEFPQSLFLLLASLAILPDLDVLLHVHRSHNCNFVKKQSYGIKQALDAISYMNGPEKLKDFLTQRIRVNIGHYQIARMTGYVPQTIKTGEILKKMMKMGDWKKIHFLIAAIFLEISAKIIAFFLFHRNKIPYKWDYAGSTKNLDG